MGTFDRRRDNANRPTVARSGSHFPYPHLVGTVGCPGCADVVAADVVAADVAPVTRFGAQTEMQKSVSAVRKFLSNSR